MTNDEINAWILRTVGASETESEVMGGSAVWPCIWLSRIIPTWAQHPHQLVERRPRSGSEAVPLWQTSCDARRHDRFLEVDLPTRGRRLRGRPRRRHAGSACEPLSILRFVVENAARALYAGRSRSCLKEQHGAESILSRAISQEGAMSHQRLVGQSYWGAGLVALALASGAAHAQGDVASPGTDPGSPSATAPAMYPTPAIRPQPRLRLASASPTASS
jgi:hypothetical protein